MHALKTYSGTIAGEQAAMYYADLVNKGRDEGGIKGSLIQAAGWSGGLFTSLWTPDTAVETAFTLATAGIGTSAKVSCLGVKEGMKVAGKTGLRKSFGVLKEGGKKALSNGNWKVFFKRSKKFELVLSNKKKYKVANLFYENRSFSAVSQQYWRGKENGKALHHIWVQNQSKWMPGWVRNSGLNLLEIPAGFNTWMGGRFIREFSFRMIVLSTLAGSAYSGRKVGRIIGDQISKGLFDDPEIIQDQY